MRLGNIAERRIYCLHGSKVCVGGASGQFSVVGRLPRPDTVVRNVSLGVLTNQMCKRLLAPVVGRYQTSNIWAFPDDHLVATLGRHLYASSDDGRTWRHSQELSPTSPLKGVLPSALCRYEGDLYLAEYGLDEGRARVFMSEDWGKSWSIFYETAGIRHFHGLYVDPYTGRLWGNTGDRDHESSIGYFRGDQYVPVGRGSQTWRGVELAFTADAILWGRDAKFLTTKPIYRLDRSDISGATTATPSRVGTTESILFYLKTVRFDGTEWVIGSTTSQTGIDRVAPPDKRRNTCPRDVRVIASSSATGFERWIELLSFERRYAIGDVVPWIPTSDAHAFIVVDPELGVLVNPYNTRTDCGEIIRIPRSLFEDGLREADADRMASSSMETAVLT